MRALKTSCRDFSLKNSVVDEDPHEADSAAGTTAFTRYDVPHVVEYDALIENQKLGWGMPNLDANFGQAGLNTYQYADGASYFKNTGSDTDQSCAQAMNAVMPKYSTPVISTPMMFPETSPMPQTQQGVANTYVPGKKPGRRGHGSLIDLAKRQQNLAKKLVEVERQQQETLGSVVSTGSTVWPLHDGLGNMSSDSWCIAPGKTIGFCPFCGANASPGWKFCQCCGSSLPPAAGASA